MKKTLILFFILSALLGAISFFYAKNKLLPQVKYHLKIDACLDRGGCWDYSHKRCEMDDNKCQKK